ncbi:N-6 DNA methylase, partial [Chryseobacterium wangxinyae]
MGFNKNQHLRENLDALRLVFALEKQKRKATAVEIAQLQRYSGFGGLKFVLNPVKGFGVEKYWTKLDLPFLPLTHELHKLLQENSINEKEYIRYVDSIRSSVLTAFYTPPQLIDSIADVISSQGLFFKNFLEPSAGAGAFINSFTDNSAPFSQFSNTFPNQPVKVTAFEKDFLTGKILKQLFPESDINISGFEEIPERHQNTFDMVASNIPFGDTSVFDLSYSRGQDEARAKSTKALHNYFFMKGTDMLRDGGLLMYITSQGVMNSPQNEMIRASLMKENNLISAIRLPNNLFSDHAGTDVGSDLIILQKNNQKTQLSEDEKLFVQTLPTTDNTRVNALFQDSHLIVHTSLKKGLDMYGKPALIYHHSEGVTGIARDVKQILIRYFSKNFHKKLYFPTVKGNLIQKRESDSSKLNLEAVNSSTQSKPTTDQLENLKTDVQLSLFDLFEERDRNKGSDISRSAKILQQQRSSNNSPQNKKEVTASNRKKKGYHATKQLDLFNSITEHSAIDPGKKNISSDTKISIKSAKRLLTSENLEPTHFVEIIRPFYRNDCLVMNNGTVGYLQEVSQEQKNAVFHPLQLSANQKSRIEQYLKIRDSYQE